MLEYLAITAYLLVAVPIAIARLARESARREWDRKYDELLGSLEGDLFERRKEAERRLGKRP